MIFFQEAEVMQLQTVLIVGCRIGWTDLDSEGMSMYES